MRTQMYLLPAMLVLNACGGGSGEETKTPEPSPSVSANPAYVQPSDQEVAGKIYDAAYSAPADFYVDERAGSGMSYSVYHVMDDAAAYERCSDDFETAKAWEEADNATRAVSGYYVGAYENGRYFEFIRELAYDDDIGNVSSPSSPGYARVFKCANTSRDGVDRSTLTGYAGRLNMTPRSASDIKTFAEYLWQFAFFPYRHKKVLDSVAASNSETLEQTLVLGFAVNQGTGRCDRIDVVHWTFSANRQNGEVMQSFETVHSFEARLESGSPILCD
ncbi:MAG: hypothetical protein AAFX56_01700 [Pseudomonadota bacterium]